MNPRASAVTGNEGVYLFIKIWDLRSLLYTVQPIAKKTEKKKSGKIEHKLNPDNFFFLP